MKHYVMLNLFQHLVFSGFRSRNPSASPGTVWHLASLRAGKFGMIKRGNSQRGQALITLLFFMIIAITITSAAVVIIFTNSLSAQKLEQGTLSYYVAESGAENALLRLLRDPNYCGETLAIDSGTATIEVIDGDGGICDGVSPFTITSTGDIGYYSRKVQVIATYISNILTITSWKEVF